MFASNEQSKLPILYTTEKGTKLKEFYADLMINSPMKKINNISSSDITITQPICVEESTILYSTCDVVIVDNIFSKLIQSVCF